MACTNRGVESQLGEFGMIPTPAPRITTGRLISEYRRAAQFAPSTPPGRAGSARPASRARAARRRRMPSSPRPHCGSAGLIGFPAPGDPYWDEEAVAGVAARYPGMDMGPYAR